MPHLSSLLTHLYISGISRQALQLQVISLHAKPVCEPHLTVANSSLMLGNCSWMGHILCTLHELSSRHRSKTAMKISRKTARKCRRKTPTRNLPPSCGCCTRKRGMRQRRIFQLTMSQTALKTGMHDVTDTFAEGFMHLISHQNLNLKPVPVSTNSVCRFTLLNVFCYEQLVPCIIIIIIFILFARNTNT